MLTSTLPVFLYQMKTPPDRSGITFEVGAKLEARDHHKNWSEDSSHHHLTHTHTHLFFPLGVVTADDLPPSHCVPASSSVTPTTSSIFNSLCPRYPLSLSYTHHNHLSLPSLTLSPPSDALISNPVHPAHS